MFQIINEWLYNRVIMGCNFDLTAYEKSEHVKGKILEISKMTGRYHHTMRRFVVATTKVRKSAVRVTRGLFPNVLCGELNVNVYITQAWPAEDFLGASEKQLCPEVFDVVFWKRPENH